MSVCCSCDDTLQKKNFKPKTLQGVAYASHFLTSGLDRGVVTSSS